MAKKPFTQMKNAIKDKDITDFLWACLSQAQQDMTVGEDEKVFTSDQLIWLIKQLVSLHRINKETAKKIKDDPKALDEWLNN